jgi:outer membrane lipoprotein SlyB
LPIDDEPLAVRDALPITKRSRGATRLTIALLVMRGVSAGFLVGVLLQKDNGSSSSSDSGAGSLAALAQQFGGALPGAGANGAAPTGSAATGGATAGGASGSGTTGQIKLIDGANIYVTDSAGKTTKVATTADSTISISQAGSLSTLKTGDTVVVVGPTGADGTVTATSITTSAEPANPTP